MVLPANPFVYKKTTNYAAAHPKSASGQENI
jgi:hypothetical protein